MKTLLALLVFMLISSTCATSQGRDPEGIEAEQKMDKIAQWLMGVPPVRHCIVQTHMAGLTSDTGASVCFGSPMTDNACLKDEICQRGGFEFLHPEIWKRCGCD